MHYELDLKSNIEGLNFIKVPDPLRSTALAVQFQLERSQYLPLETIREKQLKQIQQIIHHALATVPFYRQYYPTLSKAQAKKITWEQFKALPLLSREHIQQAGLNFHSNALPLSHGDKSYPIQTSGSTGKPVKLEGTQLMQLFFHAFALREHLWFERDLSGHLLAIRPVELEEGQAPDGIITMPYWGAGTMGLCETGKSSVINVTLPVEAQITYIKKVNPEYLLSYPSILTNIVRYCQKHNLTLGKLKGVRCFGERVTPETRMLLAEFFQAPVTDFYTSEEFGYIALQCPNHDHYHVQEEGVLVEVLKENGETCGPGEVGEVAITSLTNFATPLIRYRIGDQAEVGEPCSCGRNLSVIKRIIGRRCNLLHCPDGEKKMPHFGERKFFYDNIPDLKAVQLVQLSTEKMLAKIVMEKPPLSKKTIEKLINYSNTNIGLPFKWQIEYHNELQVGPSGKFEEFVCNIT